MFVSTIIPTIGRPTLARAVESVFAQSVSGDEFEVIVVNDSGQPLPDAPWQASPCVRVIATNQHNRSVARNAGAALARGRYLHFLDDDDWMLPGAFEAFQSAARGSEAGWLCGGFRLVDNQTRLIATIHPAYSGNCFVQLMASEWLPLQASLVSAAAFFDAGGFASLSSLAGGYEDIDLSRQIGYRHDIATSGQEVAVIRAGDDGSTTNYANLMEQNRRSREKALNMPGTYQRLLHSAGASQDSAYWFARIVYYYLASLRWNLRHRAVAVAASRAAFTLRSLAPAGRRMLSASFWRGLLSPHINQVGDAVEKRGIELYPNTTWID